MRIDECYPDGAVAPQAAAMEKEELHWTTVRILTRR
jgi:hypothetical protein